MSDSRKHIPGVTFKDNYYEKIDNTSSTKTLLKNTKNTLVSDSKDDFEKKKKTLRFQPGNFRETEVTDKKNSIPSSFRLNKNPTSMTKRSDSLKKNDAYSIGSIGRQGSSNQQLTNRFDVKRFSEGVQQKKTSMTSGRLFTARQNSTNEVLLSKKNTLFDKTDPTAFQNNHKPKRLNTQANEIRPFFEKSFTKKITKQDTLRENTEEKTNLRKEFNNFVHQKAKTERVNTLTYRKQVTNHNHNFAEPPYKFFNALIPLFQEESSSKLQEHSSNKKISRSINRKKTIRIEPEFGNHNTFTSDLEKSGRNQIKKVHATCLQSDRHADKQNNMNGVTSNPSLLETKNLHGMTNVTSDPNFKRIMKKDKDDIIKDMKKKTHGLKAKSKYIDILLEKKEAEDKIKLLEDIKQYKGVILLMIEKLRARVAERKRKEAVNTFVKSFSNYLYIFIQFSFKS